MLDSLAAARLPVASSISSLSSSVGVLRVACSSCLLLLAQLKCIRMEMESSHGLKTVYAGARQVECTRLEKWIFNDPAAWRGDCLINSLFYGDT